MEWPLLADLPAEDVRQLLAIARRRTFEKEYICEGEALLAATA